MYPSILGLTNYFGNPYAVGILTISSHLYTDYMMGNPINPSYMPSYLSTFSHKMTFMERLYNSLLYFYSIYNQMFYVIPDQDNIMRKYLGQNITSSVLASKNVSLVIYSSDLSIEYPRPLQLNSIHVGTMHIRPSLPLPDVSS